MLEPSRGAVICEAGGSIMADQWDGTDPDLELVERWREGGSKREAAERGISQRFGPELTKFFQSLRYRTQEIENLKQETFQRVFKSMWTVELHDRFYPWVLTIARNVHRDHVRRETGGKRIPNTSTEPISGPANEISSTEPSPERIAISREELRQVKSAVEQLPPRQRRCLLLRAADYEYKEIALILGITESTCRVSVYIARIRLRAILGTSFFKDGFGDL